MDLPGAGDTTKLQVCAVHANVAQKTNVISLSAQEVLHALHNIQTLLPGGRGAPRVHAVATQTFRWLVWKTGAGEDHIDRFATLDQISKLRITTTDAGVVSLRVTFNKFDMEVRSEEDDAIIDVNSFVSVSQRSDATPESQDGKKMETKRAALDVTNNQTSAAIYALTRSIRNVPNYASDNLDNSSTSTVWRPACMPALIVAALLMLRNSMEGLQVWRLEATTSCSPERETPSKARKGLLQVLSEIHTDSTPPDK